MCFRVEGRLYLKTVVFYLEKYMMTRPVRYGSTCALSLMGGFLFCGWIRILSEDEILNQLFSYLQCMFSLCSEHYFLYLFFITVFCSASFTQRLQDFWRHHVFIYFVFSYFDKTALCLEFKEIPDIQSFQSCFSFLSFFFFAYPTKQFGKNKNVFSVISNILG